jgi:hypothetical protein
MMYADWLARRTSIYFGFIDGFTLSLVFLPHSRGAFAFEVNCSFLSIFISASNSGGLINLGVVYFLAGRLKVGEDCGYISA